MNDRYVDSPPAGAEAWREVWESDARYRPRASRSEWLLRFFRRLFRRAVEPDTERQKNFNVALIDLLKDFRADIAKVRGISRQISRRCRSTRAIPMKRSRRS